MTITIPTKNVRPGAWFGCTNQSECLAMNELPKVNELERGAPDSQQN
jgi:hypothetical protein